MNRDATNTPLFIKYLKVYENNPRSTVFAPLAEGYRKAGMVEKAMDILKEGVKYHPSYITGYLGLASCYFDLSQFNLTYLTLRPLVGGNRDNIRLQKLFARTCHKMGQDDEALETYKYLLFINPKDQDTAHWVKQLEDKEQEWKDQSNHSLSDSLQNTENIFSVDNLSTGPNDSNVDNWQQIDLINKNLQKPSDLKEVKNEKKNRPTPSNVPTFTLAQLYQKQGHLDKAKDVLEKLLLANPDDLNIKKKLEEIKGLQEKKGDVLYLSSKNLKKPKRNPLKLVEEKMEAFFQAIENKANSYRLRSPEN